MANTKDNGNNNSSKPTWNDAITFVIGFATVAIGALTIYQNRQIEDQKGTLEAQKGKLEAQQNQLNVQKQRLDEANQETTLKLGLFDKVVTSIKEKDENQQQVLLVLLASLDKIDEKYRNSLTDIIIKKSSIKEIKSEGWILQFERLQKGKDITIIYRDSSVDNYEFTDFDILICKSSLQADKKGKARQVINLVFEGLDKVLLKGKDAKIGRIRVKQSPTDQWKSGITFIADKTEKPEAERIIKAIQEAKPDIPSDVFYQDDPGKKTDWLVKMVLCPKN